MKPIDAKTITKWLEDVKDPEIPVLSLVDLGVINSVTCDADHVLIEMTPTFVGCPALDVMKDEIRNALAEKGVTDVEIVVSFKKPWTSDRISAKGKKALKEFGLSPPPPRHMFTDLDILTKAECPRCGGIETELRSPFGVTLCRAIHYCRTCNEAFEQFKPL